MISPLKHQQDLVNKVSAKGQDKVLLWWGLGTGKTATSFFLANKWNDDVKLIVCPKSLVGMWTSFLSENTTEEVFDLTKPKYKEEAPAIVPGWYVINYDKLATRDWISKFKDGTVILDESSFAKHYEAARTRESVNLAFRAKHLALLSGTPCGGKWEDMWTHLLMLGRNIKRADYIKSFCNMIELRLPTGNVNVLNKKEPYKNLNILIEDLVDRGMYKLETKDCISLPGKTDITIEVPSIKAYKDFNEKGFATAGDVEFEASNISAARMGLRRLASSYNANKLDAVSDLLQSTDERVVIFHQFQEDGAKLVELCKKLGKPYAVQNGQKHDLEKPGKYESENNCVCIIQWQSGGYGLNLQKARIGVFYSLPDSYELFEQAKGRIYRNGQTMPVVYYNISAKGTIDEKIKNALDLKKDYSEDAFKKDYKNLVALAQKKEQETSDRMLPPLPYEYSQEVQLSLFSDVEMDAMTISKDPEILRQNQKKKSKKNKIRD